MPRQTKIAFKPKRRVRSTLTKKQTKDVKAITRSVVRGMMETKTVGKQAENVQLDHNIPVCT